MPDLRLFYACPLPAAVIPPLLETQARLRGAGWRGRFTDRTSWHLTLLFLGATPDALMPELTAVGAEGAQVGAAPVIRPKRVTAFPSPARARVVVLELHDPRGRLTAIRRVLQERLHVMDGREFRPHITLLRVDGARRAGKPVDPPTTQAFSLDRLVLYESTLHPDGARYDVRGAWSLAANAGS